MRRRWILFPINPFHAPSTTTMRDRRESLSLPSDDDLQSTFYLNFDHPDAIDDSKLSTAFTNLRRMKSVEQVELSNLRQEMPHLPQLQLALAINFCPRVTKISFVNCVVNNLESLYLAVAEKGELASLQFRSCQFSGDAASTLQAALLSNTIGALVFDRCKFEEGSCEIIASGVRQNNTLKRLYFIDLKYSASMHLNDSLRETFSCTSLVELGLMLGRTRSKTDGSIFRCMEPLQRLTKLSLNCSRIDLQSMKGLMQLSSAVNSLTTLVFSASIDQNAMEFMVMTLSTNNIIDNLNLEHVRLANGRNFNVSCGSLHVQKLNLSDLCFDGPSFVQTMEQMADNQFIQSLHCPNLEEEEVEKICDVFLRPNRGPSELVLKDFHEFDFMIIDELRRNMSVQSLTVRLLEPEELTSFARGLTHMSLRKLTFGCRNGSYLEYTKDFFEALQQSMEHNRTLSYLTLYSLHADNEYAKQYLPLIRYNLTLNRVGRHSLIDAHVPVGIWPHILAHTSNEADGIYFVLTGKPELVTPSRKRKDRD